MKVFGVASVVDKMKVNRRRRFGRVMRRKVSQFVRRMGMDMNV